MAVIYTDHTNKYGLTTIGLQGAANAKGIMSNFMQFMVPIESTLNEAANIIGGWINQIVRAGNDKRRDEQNYLLAADSQANTQENNMLNIIIIVIFVVALIYLGGKKK